MQTILGYYRGKPPSSYQTNNIGLTLHLNGQVGKGPCETPCPGVTLGKFSGFGYYHATNKVHISLPIIPGNSKWNTTTQQIRFHLYISFWAILKTTPKIRFHPRFILGNSICSHHIFAHEQCVLPVSYKCLIF